jgi:hypothetical protein
MGFDERWIFNVILRTIWYLIYPELLPTWYVLVGFYMRWLLGVNGLSPCKSSGDLVDVKGANATSNHATGIN